MKSVTFSEIVKAPPAGLRGLSPLTAYGLTLAVGMPLLVLALRAFDPDAPLAAIVLPLLAGLALPLGASAPGRLDVGTRFDARHMRATLDASLTALGFHAMSTGPDRIRYLKAGASPWRAASGQRAHPSRTASKSSARSRPCAACRRCWPAPPPPRLPRSPSRSAAIFQTGKVLPLQCKSAIMRSALPGWRNR